MTIFDTLIEPREAVELFAHRPSSDAFIADLIRREFLQTYSEYVKSDDKAAQQWAFLSLIATIWNAGRVQGIREERLKRRGHI